MKTHSFNQFFSRKLKEGARPIASPQQENIIVSPADSLPQGIWDFKDDGTLEADPIKNEQGVIIKSSVFITAEQLLGEEKDQEGGYAQNFYGGTLTHTYLNYDDYHRYHFPVSGKIVACYKIPYANAVGGIVYWDKEHEKYFLESDSLSWQVVETRGVIIVDTTEFANKGLVAVMPIGMGQVSSVNFEDNVKVGTTIKKGDPLGYFLFGGSDVVMLFEKSAKFGITVKRTKEEEGYYGGFEHVKCCEDYGVFDGHNF
ncbi:MAG: phosphatidylserine decarboxylase [Bacilli bacterium]|nr:phosphatidylserine decarboxylase [Bacilli bacterium]